MTQSTENDQDEAIFDANLAAVCCAIVKAGGTRVIISGCNSSGFDCAEVDHDLPAADFSCIECAWHDKEKGDSEIKLSKAIDLLLDAIATKTLRDIEFVDYEINATIDAEAGCITAQASSQETWVEVRSRPKSILAENEKSQGQPDPRAILMEAIFKIRNPDIKMPVVQSDVPGIHTRKEADDYNLRMVITALKRVGASCVTLAYAGSGDRGDNWELEARRANGETVNIKQREDQKILMCSYPFHGPFEGAFDLKITPHHVNLEMAIGLLCEGFISQHHFAYEEQYGGGGALTLDVAKVDVIWEGYDVNEKTVDRGEFHREVNVSNKLHGIKP